MQTAGSENFYSEIRLSEIKIGFMLFETKEMTTILVTDFYSFSHVISISKGGYIMAPWGFPGSSTVKNLPAKQKTWV